MSGGVSTRAPILDEPEKRPLRERARTCYSVRTNTGPPATDGM